MVPPLKYRHTDSVAEVTVTGRPDEAVGLMLIPDWGIVLFEIAGNLIF